MSYKLHAIALFPSTDCVTPQSVPVKIYFPSRRLIALVTACASSGLASWDAVAAAAAACRLWPRANSCTATHASAAAWRCARREMEKSLPQRVHTSASPRRARQAGQRSSGSRPCITGRGSTARRPMPPWLVRVQPQLPLRLRPWRRARLRCCRSDPRGHPRLRS